VEAKIKNVPHMCWGMLLQLGWLNTLSIFLQRIMGHKNIITTRQYIYLNNQDIISKHKESGILNYFLN